MKKIYTLLLCALVFINTINASLKVYAYKNGQYDKINYSMTNRSYNNLLTYLGYRPGKYYFWDENRESITVFFKILSSDVIALLTEKDLGVSLSKEKVNRILNDNNFKYKEAYDAYDVEEDLKRGIKGKYLNVQFIESATHSKCVNNVIKDNLNGYEYHFKNGIMASYKSLDGYNKWAKYYMSEWWFPKLKEIAESKFTNEKDINAYINMQCDYCAEIGNNWLYDSKIQSYNYNFGLMCMDYNYDNFYNLNDKKKIFNINEFNRIVNHEAINLSKDKNFSPVMLYKRKKYFFNFEDNLIRIEDATDDEVEDNTGEIVWGKDDKPAEYPGGMDALMTYIQKKLKYSSDAEMKNVKGTVVVKFIVDVNGMVKDAEIIKSLHPDLDRNALEIVKSFKFNPAIHNGKPIESNWSIPIRYTIQ